LGGIEFLDNCLGAAALWGEIDIDGESRFGLRRLLGLAGGEEEEKEQDKGK
jgi:hypothetical protein